MNFDGGTVKYTFEADTGGLEEGFGRVRQSIEDTVASFQELERGEEIESLQKGCEFLAKKLETLDETSEEYRLTARALEQELEALKKIEAEVADEVEKAAEETRKAQEEMAKAAEEAANALVSSRVAKMNSLWGSFSKLATGATAALVGLAKKGVAATNFLQTSQTAMSGLLGSMEEGQKAMGIAADFWSNNPFNRFDVTNATKQLVQYGRTVDQLNDDLYVLKDVSLSTGMSLDDLATRYGRIAASGRAMTIDLETMSQRGVPIYRELSKALGTTVEGVRELASQGKIDFATFKEAMEGAANADALEQYEQTLDRAKDKLSGTISTLAGALGGYKIENSEIVIAAEGIYKSWVKLLKTIAGNSKEGTGLRNKELLEGLTKIGNAVGKIIDKIADNIQPIFDFLGKLADFIGNNTSTLIPIMVGALSFLTKFGAQIPLIGNLFGGWAGKIGKVTNAITTLVAKNPLLSAFFAIIATGFVSLIQNDEEFRKSLTDLATALGDIVKSLLPIIKNLASAFAALANSTVVQGGLKLIVGLVARLAELVSSIPTEVLLTVVSAILAVKMASINPWLVWITAIGLAIDILKDIAPKFYNAAHNAVIGFVNGINEGIKKVTDAVRNLANAAVTAIRNALGIHSPSTVLEGLGLQSGLGLAKGIDESSSIVNKAMNNLAKDIYSTAAKVIGNRKDFGLIDYNGMYKDWKKVANLFTIGSEQYEAALAQMEDARKSVNQEIIQLQNDYNDALDESIKKIKNFYNLFDDVSTKGGKNASQIIKNLDKQVAQTEEWAEAQRIISNLNLDPRFVEELQQMGVSSVSELSSIANMTASELEQMNDLWLKKQSIAEDESVRQLTGFKEETLDKIDELADGIDGETVKVEEIGGRLVSSIGDGITGALPTLESAFAQLDSYIADAARGSGTGGADAGLGDIASTVEPTDTLSGLLGLGTDLKETATKWVSEKLPILLGVIGAGIAVKFIPKLKQMFSGGGVLDGLKNLLSLGKGASGAKTALDVGSKVDLSGINKLTNSLTGAGKSMSKLDKVYLAIAKGAALILLIAADIWAISSAIKKMNENLKGIEWADFGSNLGMMAATIATFAVLAGVMGIGPIAAAIAIGGAIMLELAVDIAAIATAIGYMDRAIPNDIDRIKPKIGLMAEAVLSFEALTALAGLFAALEGLGILAVLGIAEEIKQVAHALREVDENIPDDIDRVGKKVQFLADTIRFINNVGLGEVIQSIVTSFSTGPVKKIAQMYAEVAYYLGEISKVNIDFEHTRDNVVFIKDTIDFLQTQTDAITGSLNALREKAEADTVEQAARILIIFGQVVDSLNKIASLDVKQTDIVKGVQQIAKCVETVGSTLKTITYTHLGSAEGNVEKIKNIIEDFGSIVPTLNALAKGENRLNTTEVEGVVSDMDSIFSFMKDKLMGMGSFTNREKHVAAAKGIIESFDGIAKTAKTLTDADHTFDIGTEKSGLKKQIIDVADIINTLKEKLYVKTGFGTVEKQMGEVQSVLNKFSEMSLEMKKQLTDAYLIDKETHGKIKANIENIRNLVWEIEQINTSGFNDLENKVKTVESAKTIAEKFAGFADAMRAINTEGMADAGVLTDAAYRLLDGIRTGVTDKLPDMDNLGGELATHIANGAIASYDQLYAAGTQIQSAVWNGVQDKFADEYQQGIYLAYSLRDGIYSVVGQFQKVGADIQSQFWWGVQNKMGDEYNQGRAMGNTLRQGMYDVDYANAGWWAVQGFINGANNRAYGYQGVYHTGWWVADTFLRGLKERGGQGSPWKTTIESGIFAGEGLVEGLKQMESEVVNEAEVLADGIVNALDMSDVSVSPEMSVRGKIAPSMYEYGEGYGSGIYITQNNTNYTEYDVEQNLADLSYELSKI